AEGGEQAERDRPAVRDPRVAGSGLERVRERVAEVQDRALAAVVRVAEADGRLESGAAAHELVLGQLPQRLTGQQARRHDLAQAPPGGTTVPVRSRRRSCQRRSRAANVFASSPCGSSCVCTSRWPRASWASAPWMPATFGSETSATGPSPGTSSPSLWSAPR